MSATFDRPNHETFLSVPAVLCIVIHIPTSDNKSCMDSIESKGITHAKSTLAPVQHIHGTNGSGISQRVDMDIYITLGQDMNIHNDCNWTLSNF